MYKNKIPPPEFNIINWRQADWREDDSVPVSGQPVGQDQQQDDVSCMLVLVTLFLALAVVIPDLFQQIFHEIEREVLGWLLLR